MKLLIRTFSLVILLLIFSVIIIRFNNINIIINEMHNATYLSIEETMLKEMKYLNKALDEIDLNKEFESSFESLVKNKDIYNIKTKADKDKGILKVEVDTNSKFIKPISLINIIEHTIEPADEYIVDKFDVKSFSKYLRKDTVLYSKELEEPMILNSFYIDIEAYTLTNNESVLNRYEPEMTITLVDENGKTFTYNKKPVVGRETLNEVNFKSEDYNYEKIKVKSVKLEMKGIDKNIAPKAELLRIGSTKNNYFKYQKDLHTLYSRYIDLTFAPQDNSLWLKKDYKETLSDYLK